MPRFKDRTNDNYGRLTVIKHAGKDIRGKHLWLCICECGDQKIVVSDNLSSGKSKSCGCLKREFLARSGNQYARSVDREEALLKVQYSHLKRRNSKMGHKQVMPFDRFIVLSKSACKYCGIEYSKEVIDRLNGTKSGKRMSDYILKCNGIDRVDNRLGYTIENSVACCKFCNFAKHTMAEKDFYKWIERIYNHSIGTTGVACKNTNREFIGIELDEKYFEIARDRIELLRSNCIAEPQSKHQEGEL